MRRLITILLGATLVGCAGVAHKQPVLISEDSKPNWVEEYELEDSTHLFFTGISTKYAEERKALKDAKYDALAKFLDYCGLHTKLHEKYISQVHGSTANVLSATTKIETQLEINSEAQVGQFRIVRKYIEVYSGTRGKFYKMYVFASVPKIEVARVKAWQKENDLRKIAKLNLLNNEQSEIIEQTIEELKTVQKQLGQLTFLREQVVKLSADNKELITENKQLKEIFHKDKEKNKELELAVKISTEQNTKLFNKNQILAENNLVCTNTLRTAKGNEKLVKYWREKYHNKNPIQALTSWLIKNDDDGMGLTPIND
ncbi:MAG: hypothetical protein CL489_05100 [Acidobacteria bacterium]|nr:hypothetical protein [Acidobacteriota bacterium]|tara:strand:+ start:991 stop:1932 length:942 start_codon:yes stop_codon:yes gene_type:complete